MLSLSQSAVATGSNSRHSSEVQTDNGLQAKTYEDEASDLCQDSSRVDLTGIRRKLLGRQATLATTSKLSTVCSRYHSNHGAATSGGHNQAGVCVRVWGFFVTPSSQLHSKPCFRRLAAFHVRCFKGSRPESCERPG